jgi:hypothetical protein
MAPRNVSGTWTIEQSNGWRTDVTLTQNGSELSGTARTSAGLDEDFSQELDGTVSGTNFALNITWPQARGRYEGTFQPDGTLTGVTFDVQHPSSQATWFGGFDKKFPAA